MVEKVKDSRNPDNPEDRSKELAEETARGLGKETMATWLKDRYSLDIQDYATATRSQKQTDAFIGGLKAVATDLVTSGWLPSQTAEQMNQAIDALRVTNRIPHAEAMKHYREGLKEAIEAFSSSSIGIRFDNVATQEYRMSPDGPKITF